MKDTTQFSVAGEPIVFVVQDVPKLNLMPAKKFGTLRIMFPPGDHLRDIERAVNILASSFGSYQKQDYLLPIGDPTLIGLAIGVALHTSMYSIKVMRWDRQEQQYDIITLPRMKSWI